MALTAIANAQTTWSTNGTHINNANSGNVGIGTNIPGYKSDLVTTAYSDGLRLKQTGSGAVGVHLWNATTNGRSWGMFSLGAGDALGAGNFAIYDVSSNINRFFISGGMGTIPAGYIGIGTGAPGYKLDVQSAVMNDGINITQTTAHSAALHLSNNTA
ncbi:MAG: hypothetical protein H0W73_17045 [Bacteroidetes bacterium]|nr:hypothetical protein [Bacteroidota bacterium]